MKFEKDIYEKYYRYDDDSDINCRCYNIRVVKTKKEHKCWMSFNGHLIKKNEHAINEKAVVDDKWYSTYTCMNCADDILINVAGLDPDFINEEEFKI